MSLINQALRRARDESLRREAANRGVPLPAVHRPRERTHWLAVAVVALGIALVASLVVVLNLSSRLTTGATPEPVEVIAVPASRAAAAQRPVEPTAPRAPAEASRPQGKPDSPPASPTPLASAAVPPATEPVPQVTQPTIAASESPAEGPAEGPHESRTFVRHAELTAGRTVDLGGIAWSETGPYALLNGRVVGVGESVQGYLVTEINPGEVTLERDEDRVVLRLK